MVDREKIRSHSGNGKHVAICHFNEGFEKNPEEEIKPVLIDQIQILNVEFQEDQSKLKAVDETAMTDGNGNEKDQFTELARSSSFPKIEKRPKAAVTVRNAVKSYGSSGPEVLKNFSMTVQKGTIYSLLGSSGCGKTTLLQAVVGIKHLNSGDILVFGAKPGTKESGIPGRRCGYMPQDTALYNDFTIFEAMRYFGTIYGMTSSEIKSSQDFLIEFLDLPDASRRIGTLSGGQKRRVSLSVSLIHSPELLILDEPTVGVDPLLRESIWSHLCKLVSSKETTVIITTHYIEEARSSNMIGLMRGGRLLAEKNPEALLKEYNTSLLEEIVLKMCRKDTLGNFQEDVRPTIDPEEDLENPDEFELVEPYQKDRKSSHPAGKRRMSMIVLDTITSDSNEFMDTLNRLRALVRKNTVVMTRNFILLIFMILVPAMQVFIICIAIGNDPRRMHVGVVNHETNYTDVCLKQHIKHEGCDVENLSCQYLLKIPAENVYLTEYANEELARDAVKSGKSFGFMTFPERFSDNVYARSASGSVVDNETLEGSQVLFEMDLTSKQIALALKRIFYDAYKDFVKELLTGCGFHPELGESPIKYVTPIYGTDDTDFREFVAPSVLLGLVFFFPLCSSGISYIWDKKQGTLERARVAGVRTSEIMTAFFVTEGCVLLIQAGLSFSIVTVMFAIPVQGSVWLAMGLTILIGLAGVSMGFLIASICNEEIEAVLLAMASFFPNFLLAGMLWPIEGMPALLQYFSYILPCTLAGESIRSIISRGWGFFHPNVWPGYLTTVVWIIIYWTITVCIHKIILSKK